FVFTPKGDLIRVPFEATPVDFAYMIHTDVGHRISGARVNGTLVPLQTQLENGDTVEVITSHNQVPSRDWLRFVRSSKAKQRIRAFLKSEEHARSMAIGMEVLSKDLRKVKMSLKKLEKSGELKKVAEYMGLKGESDLYAQIGYGKVSSSKVLARVLPEGTNVEQELKTESSPLERIFQRAARASREKVGVQVSGLDDLLVRFAKCCEPLPGDRIVGFITRGRGVTVHRADCAQVLRSDPLRRVDVSWDIAVKAPRKVRLTIHSQDTIGLLSEVTRAMTNQGANISSAQVKTTEGNKAIHYFEMSVEDADQLEKVIRSIESVPGVLKVERVRRPRTALDIPN
ncbi:MAG: bifunctional (p)ppGpp synthetase/guanosine-3',5'-bis(diphosphate) 3'-pyrophosphohydrolase, partial [Bdellovibrionales bacterium]|nr:bifunctional (p)ppGpp synthetase/guanosine-3',5'-bis(diphosphate) 3'-pyrophosphohydrolase [Bdellovibrionales bacterium]